MSAQCRRKGRGAMGVEWVDDEPKWPVLRSAQDVAREEAEGLAESENSATEVRGASSSAQTDNRREEDK